MSHEYDSFGLTNLGNFDHITCFLDCFTLGTSSIEQILFIMGCLAQRNDSIVSSKEEFAILLRMLTNNNETAITKTPTQKEQRRVRFAKDEISKSYVPQHKTFTQEQKEELWFDAQTISSFRNEAISTVRKLQKNDDQSSSTVTVARGLERWAIGRQVYRHKTIQCILSLYRQGKHTPQEIMTMAQKCSSWNIEIALFQACHDYYEAYTPQQQQKGQDVDATPTVSPMPFELNTPPPFPFELIKKDKRKKLTTTSATTENNSDNTERRVRPKTIQQSS